jgi:hypothetical protein
MRRDARTHERAETQIAPLSIIFVAKARDAVHILYHSERGI